MSRRATAKRSAAPSPTPKSTEGNNPSGFILKLFQMVNGAPDDVVSVSKFFVPSFSFVLFGMGTYIWPGYFAKGGTSNDSTNHKHKHAFSGGYLGGIGASPIQHILCQHLPRHQISSFLRAFPTGQFSTFHCAMCSVQIYALSAASLRTQPNSIVLQCASAALFDICWYSSADLSRLPWNIFLVLSSFVTKMCIWPPAQHRIPANKMKYNCISCINGISSAVCRVFSSNGTPMNAISVQFSIEPLPNFFFLFEYEARASLPVIACFPPNKLHKLPHHANCQCKRLIVDRIGLHVRRYLGPFSLGFFGGSQHRKKLGWSRCCHGAFRCKFRQKEKSKASEADRSFCSGGCGPSIFLS